MKRITYSLLFFTALLINSCGNKNDFPSFEHAGGTLSLAIDNQPSTFNPAEITDIYSATVLSQLLEGLVSFNPEDLTIRPQLAASWKISPDGISYVFKLRDNAYFHENEGFESDEDRLFTPEDVKFSFEKACKPNEKGEPSSAYLSIFKDQLVGAKSYFENKSKSISGVKIDLTQNTVELTLCNPDPNFISKLAQITVAISSSKIDITKKNANLVGTGPFKFSEITTGTPPIISLVRNEEYYLTDAKGYSLPYLDKVEFVVEPRKLEQLDLFEQGKTHVINTLPTSRITQMLDGKIKDFNSKPPKLILYNNPLLSTNYYFFNMTEDRFKDPRVRQAFNYAINRTRITQDVLRGQAYEDGIYGIVPPISSSFKNYNFKNIKQNGYDFNPEKAKQLLAEAGYPGGKGFGSVNLRMNIGDVNSSVAEEISSQIFEVLGINVNIDGSTFELKDEDADYARGDLFRSAWFADYLSPENFLANFYGKYVPKSKEVPSQINQARYINEKFDQLFEKGRKATNLKEQYNLFNQAEVELLKNPPMIILWYAGDIQLIYSKVRNLKNNPMRLLDLKQVYLKDWTKEEYLKTIQK